MKRHGGIAAFIVLFGIALIAPNLASAADIEKHQSARSGIDIFTIKGEIVKGDGQRFADMSAGSERAIVVLDSPGGLMIPALQIGKEIKLKGYATAVVATCTSSCAFIWLAGAPRMLEKYSDVGFHTAWLKMADGKEVKFTLGDSIVGLYIKSLGLSDAVTTFATAAGPTDIKWLSKVDASRLGLATDIIDNKSNAWQTLATPISFK
jgi:hypothetical protein